MRKFLSFTILSLLPITIFATPSPAIKTIVDQTIEPMMAKYHIPGMSVAVTVNGKNYFYNYGVMSTDTRQPVTNSTLFEIGSDTKTLTATLASCAALTHHLSFNDPVSKYIQPLNNSVFDNISLLNLGTQSSGLPLFVPNNIKSYSALFAFLQHWKPPVPIGTHRIYSNIGIGLLALATEESLHDSYNHLLTNIILQPLKMDNTFTIVPKRKRQEYAEGYTQINKPTRLRAATLSQQTNGIRSCTKDLIRFIQANMGELKISPLLQSALLNTHTGYYQSHYLTQDLVWEQYSTKSTLNTVIAGNGKTYLEATPIKKLNPPLPPQKNIFINKTGETDGFSSYFAFIPKEKIGIVMLANKSYPVASEVKAGYTILNKITALNA